MSKIDFSPNSVPNSVPYGFDYWEPHWKLVEETRNGKIIRRVIKDAKPEVTESKTETPHAETKSFFKCDSCDFTTEKERAIKMHVQQKHKVKQ